MIKLNRFSKLILKVMMVVNLITILIAFVQKREEFHDKKILFFFVLYSAFLFVLSGKSKTILILNLFLQYFYFTILTIELIISGFIYLQSINYPLYLFFYFDRSEESGDFLIVIPVLFLLVNFVFNHFLLFKWKNGITKSKI